MEPEAANLSDFNETDSDHSFDEGGPVTYSEWRDFVLQTYLNGTEHHRVQQQASSEPERVDFKAKVARKANKPQPPPSAPKRIEDTRGFKVPVRDASGNPTTSNPFALTTKSTTLTAATISNNFATVTPSPLPLPLPLPPSSSSYNKTVRGQMSTSKGPTFSSVPSSLTRITKSSNYHENNTKPVGKTVPSAHLKTRSDVFWSLNSATKLLHVKAQLDEPSKVYIDKLVKNNGIAQREILKLRKEKQDLLNTIKMVQRVISDPSAIHNQQITEN